MSEAKQEARQNWADESDGDDDQREIGQAVRLDHKVIDPNMGKKANEPKKNIPPPEARERNQFGDFVVTKVVIPDLKPKVEHEEKPDSDESSESEQSEPEQETQEEVKEAKPKQKQLSKAEKKKLEDEEFERVFKEMGLEKNQPQN